jgi:hypothetical protein
MNLNNYYKILCIIVLLQLITKCAKLRADTIEYGQNVFTLHTFDRSEAFEHKVDSRGMLMTNPIGYIRYNNVAVLKGRDSVNSKMMGAIYFYKLNYGEIVIGGYSYNQGDWGEVGLYNRLAIKGRHWGVIPIIGFNAPFIIYQNREYKIRMNNIITPLTINSFIAIQKEF